MEQLKQTQRRDTSADPEIANLAYTLSENYEVVEQLGEGSYGKVFKCFKRDTEEMVAVKVLNEHQPGRRKPREVVMMDRLKSLDPDTSNIVRLHEWFHRNEQTFMVYELLHKTLCEHLKETEPTPVPLHGVRSIIRDLATALKDLHEVGVIHGDLKPDNIMLVDGETQPFRVKLIDLGLSLPKETVRRGLCVQALWHRAPEVILGLPFTGAIDIWALGTVVAELILGFAPFQGRHDYDVLCCIIEFLGDLPKSLLDNGLNTNLLYNKNRKFFGCWDWTLKTPTEFFNETGAVVTKWEETPFTVDDLKKLNLYKNEGVGTAEWEDCIDLVKEMLQVDPENRITPHQILAHSFMTGSYQGPSPSPSTQSPTALLPDVIKVQPAETNIQKEGTSKETSGTSSQAVVSKMANGQNTVNLFLESVSDCDLADDSGLEVESVAESVSTGSTEDSTTVPIIPENNNDESSHCGGSESKKGKRRGIRGFFSALKRKFSCCCRVHPASDE